MGVTIGPTFSHFEFAADAAESSERRMTVLHLARRVIDPMLASGNGLRPAYLIVATSCPDSLAPSVGQMLAEHYHDRFADSHVIDMVQGCAGGVGAMILGSRLAESSKDPVLVVQADAARKATHEKSDMHRHFGNGAFACLISGNENGKGLIHSKTKQYRGLVEVVNIRLGHDADRVIMAEKDIKLEPRKFLGLTMNRKLAMQLLRQAESFYLDFVSEAGKPDVMILHQAGDRIVGILRALFSKYEVEFIDRVKITGNCGAATTGILLDQVAHTLAGKKVMMCSYGTGGVITAGMWQF